MGCRPSKHATSKIRDAHARANQCTCMYSPRKYHKKHKCNSNGTGSRRTSGGTQSGSHGGHSSTGHRSRSHKSDDTEFPAFSTTTAVYRRSASKASKITLRLSSDGSTLEIERCDYNIAKAKLFARPMTRPWSSAPNLSRFNDKGSPMFRNANEPLRPSASAWTNACASRSTPGSDHVPVNWSNGTPTASNTVDERQLEFRENGIELMNIRETDLLNDDSNVEGVSNEMFEERPVCDLYDYGSTFSCHNRGRETSNRYSLNASVVRPMSFAQEGNFPFHSQTTRSVHHSSSIASNQNPLLNFCRMSQIDQQFESSKIITTSQHRDRCTASLRHPEPPTKRSGYHYNTENLPFQTYKEEQNDNKINDAIANSRRDGKKIKQRASIPRYDCFSIRDYNNIYSQSTSSISDHRFHQENESSRSGSFRCNAQKQGGKPRPRSHYDNSSTAWNEKVTDRDKLVLNLTSRGSSLAGRGGNGMRFTALVGHRDEQWHSNEHLISQQTQRSQSFVDPLLNSPLEPDAAVLNFIQLGCPVSLPSNTSHSNSAMESPLSFYSPVYTFSTSPCRPSYSHRNIFPDKIYSADVSEMSRRISDPHSIEPDIYNLNNRVAPSTQRVASCDDSNSGTIVNTDSIINYPHDNSRRNTNQKLITSPGTPLKRKRNIAIDDLWRNTEARLSAIIKPPQHALESEVCDLPVMPFPVQTDALNSDRQRWVNQDGGQHRRDENQSRWIGNGCNEEPRRVGSPHSTVIDEGGKARGSRGSIENELNGGQRGRGDTKGGKQRTVLEMNSDIGPVAVTEYDRAELKTGGKTTTVTGNARFALETEAGRNIILGNQRTVMGVEGESKVLRSERVVLETVEERKVKGDDRSMLKNEGEREEMFIELLESKTIFLGQDGTTITKDETLMNQSMYCEDSHDNENVKPASRSRTQSLPLLCYNNSFGKRFQSTLPRGRCKGNHNDWDLSSTNSKVNQNENCVSRDAHGNSQDNWYQQSKLMLSDVNQSSQKHDNEETGVAHQMCIGLRYRDKIDPSFHPPPSTGESKESEGSSPSLIKSTYAFHTTVPGSGKINSGPDSGKCSSAEIKAIIGDGYSMTSDLEIPHFCDQLDEKNTPQKPGCNSHEGTVMVGGDDDVRDITTLQSGADNSNETIVDEIPSIVNSQSPIDIMLDAGHANGKTRDPQRSALADSADKTGREIAMMGDFHSKSPLSSASSGFVSTARSPIPLRILQARIIGRNISQLANRCSDHRSANRVNSSVSGDVPSIVQSVHGRSSDVIAKGGIDMETHQKVNSLNSGAPCVDFKYSPDKSKSHDFINMTTRSELQSRYTLTQARLTKDLTSDYSALSSVSQLTCGSTGEHSSSHSRQSVTFTGPTLNFYSDQNPDYLLSLANEDDSLSKDGVPTYVTASSPFCTISHIHDPFSDQDNNMFSKDSSISFCHPPSLTSENTSQEDDTTLLCQRHSPLIMPQLTSSSDEHYASVNPQLLSSHSSDSLSCSLSSFSLSHTLHSDNAYSDTLNSDTVHSDTPPPDTSSNTNKHPVDTLQAYTLKPKQTSQCSRLYPTDTLKPNYAPQSSDLLSLDTLEPNDTSLCGDHLSTDTLKPNNSSQQSDPLSSTHQSCFPRADNKQTCTLQTNTYVTDTPSAFIPSSQSHSPPSTPHSTISPHSSPSSQCTLSPQSTPSSSPSPSSSSSPPSRLYVNRTLPHPDIGDSSHNQSIHSYQNPNNDSAPSSSFSPSSYRSLATSPPSPQPPTLAPHSGTESGLSILDPSTSCRATRTENPESHQREATIDLDDRLGLKPDEIQNSPRYSPCGCSPDHPVKWNSTISGGENHKLEITSPRNGQSHDADQEMALESKRFERAERTRDEEEEEEPGELRGTDSHDTDYKGDIKTESFVDYSDVEYLSYKEEEIKSECKKEIINIAEILTRKETEEKEELENSDVKTSQYNIKLCQCGNNHRTEGTFTAIITPKAADKTAITPPKRGREPAIIIPKGENETMIITREGACDNAIITPQGSYGIIHNSQSLRRPLTHKSLTNESRRIADDPMGTHVCDHLHGDQSATAEEAQAFSGDSNQRQCFVTSPIKYAPTGSNLKADLDNLHNILLPAPPTLPNCISEASGTESDDNENEFQEDSHEENEPTELFSNENAEENYNDHIRDNGPEGGSFKPGSQNCDTKQFLFSHPKDTQAISQIDSNNDEYENFDQYQDCLSDMSSIDEHQSFTQSYGESVGKIDYIYGDTEIPFEYDKESSCVNHAKGDNHYFKDSMNCRPSSSHYTAHVDRNISHNRSKETCLKQGINFLASKEADDIVERDNHGDLLTFVGGLTDQINIETTKQTPGFQMRDLSSDTNVANFYTSIEISSPEHDPESGTGIDSTMSNSNTTGMEHEQTIVVGMPNSDTTDIENEQTSGMKSDRPKRKVHSLVKLFESVSLRSHGEEKRQDKI